MPWSEQPGPKRCSEIVSTRASCIGNGDLRPLTRPSRLVISLPICRKAASTSGIPRCSTGEAKTERAKVAKTRRAGLNLTMLRMRTRDQIKDAKVGDVPAAHFARFYIRQCSSNVLWSVPHDSDA
jgi:hypothetical protein